MLEVRSLLLPLGFIVGLRLRMRSFQIPGLSGYGLDALWILVEDLN